MSSNQPTKGNTAHDLNATATQRVDNAALGLFNELQKMNGDPPLDDLTPVHVEADNLKMLIRDVAVYLAITKIPDRHSKKVEKYIGHQTKDQYLTKIKEMLRGKFPQHELWPSEPIWFKGSNSSLKLSKVRAMCSSCNHLKSQHHFQMVHHHHQCLVRWWT
jgi:hypothetical protein